MFVNSVLYWSQMESKRCTLVHLALASKNVFPPISQIFTKPSLSNNARNEILFISLIQQTFSLFQKTYGLEVHSGLVGLEILNHFYFSTFVTSGKIELSLMHTESELMRAMLWTGITV